MPFGNRRKRVLVLVRNQRRLHRQGSKREGYSFQSFHKVVWKLFSKEFLKLHPRGSHLAGQNQHFKQRFGC